MTAHTRTYEGKGRGKPQASLSPEQERQLERHKRRIGFKRVMAETHVSYYTFEKLGNGGKADAESVARVAEWLNNQLGENHE